MGWLWTCLGGGATVQAHRMCSGDRTSSRSRSHRGGNQPHGLRLHQLPTQLPRNGYGEKSMWKAGAGRGKCGEPENMESFMIPGSSVSTCISINTLKKASEGSTGASFRSELGLSLRSDVDDLKEELAALRQRLANEEAEAKKLREEISHLRSCGVLQKSEDALDSRKSQDLTREENNDPFLRYAEAIEKKNQQGGDVPAKQLRKCFSGPLLFDESSSLSEDCSGRVGHSTQVRISSHRVGLSPKPHTYFQEKQPGDGSLHHSNQIGGDGLVPPRTLSRTSISGHNKLMDLESSLSLAAWVSQTAKDHRFQGQHEGKDSGMNCARAAAESMDVQWIEVQSAPCPSSSSTNVRRISLNASKDDAKSSHMSSTSMRAVMAGTDATIKDHQKSGGKRRQKRSGDHEPTEKRPKDQSLVSNSLSPALLPEEIEVQLSLAVATFKQQKRELDAKHQALCQGPISASDLPTPSAINVFRNPKKKSLAVRSRGFRRPLSPVKEALSIEEIAWSRQSSNRNESAPASESDCLVSRKDVAFVSLRDTYSNIDKNQKFETLVEAAEVVRSSPIKPGAYTVSLEKQKGDLDETSLRMENLALVPIQCASPSVTTKRRSSSSALDALCAQVITSHAPHEGRYELGDSVEENADWNDYCEYDEDVDGIEMRPIECASPSFSPKRKSSRGPVSQAISLEPEKFSSLLASPTESLGKGSPLITRQSLDDTSLQSPNQDLTVAPFREWTSAHDNAAVHPQDDRSWYSDAIDAIKSINDIRSSKERRLLTEAASKENSPAVKQQRQVVVRPPHCNSAEKKVLRRAFSWYASENDERMRAAGFNQTFLRKEPDEWEEGEGKPLRNLLAVSKVQNRTSVHKARASDENQAGSNAKKVSWMEDRKDAGPDSGETATFSIDFNHPDSSQNDDDEPRCAMDGGDSYINRASSRSSQQAERADKENIDLRSGQAIGRNSTLRTPEKVPYPIDHNKQLRKSQDTTPELRPVLGSAAVHWENVHSYSTPQSGLRKSTDNCNEDGTIKWHATSFEERVERALARESDVPSRTPLGVRSKLLRRSNSIL